MPNHERDCRSLLLGERQELRRNFAQSVAIKRHKFAIQKPYRTENNNSGSSGGSPERFSLFDQQMCTLDSRLGFRRRVSFDVDQRLMSATWSLICSRRNAAVPGNAASVQSARELFDGFDQRRAL